MSDENIALITVTIVSFIFGCFFGGFLVNKNLKELALNNNVAYYDSKTGDFTFKDLSKEVKK